MNSNLSPAESRLLPWLTALFILAYFTFFTYRGLSSYFTFDDGTTVIAVLKPFETPWWRDLLHIVTVFTAAFRPLTTLYWRPLYAIFGFHPLPYRIVFQLLMMANIGVAYALARRLEATRAAAALTALLFCYNAATIDLLYDTCLVGDVMCFLFCGLALIAFTGDRPRIIAGIVCFLLALDSKEVGAAFPGVLLFYHLLYRRGDFRDPRKRLRVIGLLAAVFVASAAYLSVKVADMSHNDAYATHPTVGFLLSNLAHYLEILLYFPEKTFSVPVALLILAAVAALGFLLRIRPITFGVLFFGTALIPVAAIAPRAGYAAYVAYFGLALSAGTLLDALRTRILPRLQPRAATASAIALFLVIAIALGVAHAVKRQPTIGYYEWSTPAAIAMMKGFEQTVPEFPPGARVLITKDPWPPDWGQMCLLRLLYHDNSLWVDRTKNMDRPPDTSAYDLVVAYTEPDVELVPARWFRHPVKWEIRSRLAGPGQFIASSPNAHGAASLVTFSPTSARKGQPVTITVPGLSDVTVSVLYRLQSGGKSETRVVEDWCKLDSRGTCTVVAPSPAGNMRIDWLQPAHQRWILTSGGLSITD